MTVKKFLDWAVITVVGAIFTWGIWSTNELFAQKAELKVIKESAKVVCEKVDELKKQAEKTDDKREQDKQDIMKELLKIQRQLKK